ncbi:MAG: sugar-binding protein, partial [Verrucomicrobiota bacterium]
MKQILSARYLTVGLLALSLPLCAQISYLDTMDTELQSFKLLSASCNRTDTPPVVDGVLNDEAWKTATSLGNFSNTVWGDTKKPDWQKTTAWVTHDDRYLYFAFSCDENDMSKVRAEAFRQDHADVLYDDRIEIYLDPFHNHKELLRFAFNTKGIGYATTIERPVQYSVSVIRGDDRWNTEWRVKTKVEESRWTAEVAIALDRIFPDPITPGTTWGMNLIRDRHARHDHTSRHGDRFKGPFLTPDTQQITAWKPVFFGGPKMWSFIDMWLEPNQFGDLIFDQNVLRVKEMLFHEAYANFYGDIWNKPQFFGDNPVEAVLQNDSPKPLDLILRTETIDFKGDTAVIEKQVKLGAKQTQTFASEIPVRNNERVPFTFTVLNQDGGQQLFQSSYDTRVPPFVEFDLSGVYSAGKDKPSMEVSPVVIPGSLEGTTITLELYRRGETKPMATDRLTNLKPYDFVPCLQDVDLAT